MVSDNQPLPLNQRHDRLFDIEKNETRHPIATVDDIYSFADILKATAALYS